MIFKFLFISSSGAFNLFIKSSDWLTMFFPKSILRFLNEKILIINMFKMLLCGCCAVGCTPTVSHWKPNCWKSGSTRFYERMKCYSATAHASLPHSRDIDISICIILLIKPHEEGENPSILSYCHSIMKIQL